MDPNEARRRMRALTAKLKELTDQAESERLTPELLTDIDITATELADVACGLSAWLASGGFYPTEGNDNAKTA